MTDEECKKLIDELLMHGTGITQQLCERAAHEIENLDAARLNNEYQRDTALAALKDANERLQGLAERVEQLEARIEALGRM